MGKICMTDNIIKTCNLEIAGCIGCNEEQPRITVNRLTDSELLDMASGYSEHRSTLSSLIEDLENFRAKSKMSKSKQDELFSFIRRICELSMKVDYCGSTIYFNTLFNYLNAHSEEAEEQ